MGEHNVNGRNALVDETPEGVSRRRVIESEAVPSNVSILNLMQPLLEALTYDEIQETEYEDYWLYDIINASTTVTTFKIWESAGDWRIREVATEFTLGTLVDDEELVQEDGSKIALES